MLHSDLGIDPHEGSLAVWVIRFQGLRDERDLIWWCVHMDICVDRRWACVVGSARSSSGGLVWERGWSSSMVEVEG